jgi:hypothetical protein
MAEASAIATPSFTLRLFPTLGDQLGYEVTVFGNVARYNRLSHPDRLFRGAQTQFSLSDRLDQKLVGWLQTGGRAAVRRDYDSTLLVDARSPLHDTCPNS